MTYKILTVDDSRTIRMIVKKAFEPYDCELLEAENGEQGLDVVAKVHPDLIVLDITMPVMNGIEMLTRLKEDDALKDTPIIMLTAESGKDHVMQIVKMGVNDYIVKPFRGEQLIDRADKLIHLKKDGETDSDHAKSATKDIFTDEKELVILTFPPKVTRSVGARVDSAVKRKIKEMLALGIKKMIVDLSPVDDVNMSAIQVIISLADNCINNKISARIVADENQSEALKGFQETSQYSTQPSIEHARAAF